MSEHAPYQPGSANGEVRKDGDKWTVVMVRDLRHSPERVWRSLTDPAELSQWAPYDADRSLATAGATVKLTTVNAPSPMVSETTILRADAPKLLEFAWGGGEIRWELAPHNGGTRLTLLANIDRRYVSMGAAGWHICLDVLDRELSGAPIGRMVGMPVLKFEGWQRLNGEYAQRFGAEVPKW